MERIIEKIKNTTLFKKIYYGWTFGNKQEILKDEIKGVFKRTFVKYNEFKEEIKGYTLYRDIEEGDFVIDAGAYQGFFTVYASKKAGKRGKVFSFEPIPWNFRILKKNVLNNKLHNTILVNAGLYNFDGKIRFWAKGGSSRVDNNGNITLKVVTIDSFLKKRRVEAEKINFVKMDIEGAEIAAVKGATKLIKKGNAFWAIASYHMINGKPTFKFIEKFFEKYGYNVLTQNKDHLTTFAWKDDDMEITSNTKLKWKK